MVDLSEFEASLVYVVSSRPSQDNIVIPCLEEIVEVEAIIFKFFLFSLVFILCSKDNDIWIDIYGKPGSY